MESQAPSNLYALSLLTTEELLIHIHTGNSAAEEMSEALNYTADRDISSLRRVCRGLAAIAVLQDRWLPNPDSDETVGFSRRSLGAALQNASETDELKSITEWYTDEPIDFSTLEQQAPNYTAENVVPEPLTQQPEKTTPVKNIRKPKRTAEEVAADKEARDHLTEELIARIKEGDKAALTELFELNTGIIHYWVYKYKNPAFRHQQHFDIDDLFQQACLGFMNAAERYELNRNAKFTTFAGYHIVQQMSRYMADTRATVRIPVHTRQMIQRLVRAEDEFEAADASPSLAELASASFLNVNRIYELMHARTVGDEMETLSSIITTRDREDRLDDSVLEESEICSPILADGQAQSFEERVMVDQLGGVIQDVLAELDERERRIIKLRYGLDEYAEAGPRTLEQVGDEFELTRERIRQIEARALSKLRNPFHTGPLHEYL